MTIIPSDSGVSPAGARRAADASRIEISERSPAHADAARLLHAFHAEQVDRYGFADPVDLRPGDYAPPHGVFAVVYKDEQPVGCGGYRWFDRAAHTVEVKKVYVTPAVRGHGFGRVLLAWLERHAVATGAGRVLLETGVRNTAALRLFAAAGYEPVDGYVAGRDPEINRAFARSLTTSL